METFVPAGQLYGPILPAFIMTRAISLGAKIAYAFLCDFAGKKDHCWPAQKTLASRMGCSLSSIKVYLGELQKENLISVSRKGFSVSVYTLLKPSPEFDHPQPESGYRTNLKNFKKEESPLPPKRSQSRAAAGGRKGGIFVSLICDLKLCGAHIHGKKRKSLLALPGILSGGVGGFLVLMC